MYITLPRWFVLPLAGKALKKLYRFVRMCFRSNASIRIPALFP